MLLLAMLLRRELPLRGVRLGEALGKTAAAGAFMALVTITLTGLLQPPALGRGGALLLIAVAGGLGALCYLGLCLALRVEALEFFVQALMDRLRARAVVPIAARTDD
jgi:putative peptidoglycan lipid II flippase